MQRTTGDGRQCEAATTGWRAAPVRGARDARGKRHDRRVRLGAAAAGALEVLERRTLFAGAFEPRADYTVTGSAEFVALADLNGDAFPDMIVSSYAGSLLSVRLQGATQEQLRRWSWRETADALDFPPEKRGRLLVLEDAVHALADDWQRRIVP